MPKESAIPFYHESHALTRDLRDVLIEHLDGKEVPLSSVEPKSRRQRTFSVLRTMRMLRGVPEEMPRHTIITDKGRHELAKMLADYADAFLRIAMAREDQAEMRKERLQLIGIRHFIERPALQSPGSLPPAS